MKNRKIALYLDFYYAMSIVLSRIHTYPDSREKEWHLNFLESNPLGRLKVPWTFEVPWEAKSHFEGKKITHICIYTDPFILRCSRYHCIVILLYAYWRFPILWIAYVPTSDGSGTRNLSFGFGKCYEEMGFIISKSKLNKAFL